MHNRCRWSVARWTDNFTPWRSRRKINARSAGLKRYFTYLLNSMPSELTAQTIAIVKSTAPVLEEHGELLTRHFYKRMFQHNPEVAPFFNQANQGAGLQQKALAAAICA